jgi:hypothetical protein
LITCGQDGEVRIFQGIDDDDCVTHAIGEQAHAVAYVVSAVLMHFLNEILERHD